MAKKMTKPAANAPEPTITGALVTIALDGGYGAIKALTPGKPPLIFSSVAGRAIDLGFQETEIAAAYPGDQITDDEGSWFVGALAQKMLIQPGQLQYLRGETADDDARGNVFRLRMAKAAIGKLLSGSVTTGDVVHIRLATGLPVGHMNNTAQFKATLIGQHHIKTDSADFIANISEVMVIPQAYAAIYAQSLTAIGEVNDKHTATRTGVIDAGTYTVDLAVDDDGEFVSAESGSAAVGAYTAQEDMITLLRDYGIRDISIIDAEAVLNGTDLKIQGKPISAHPKLAGKTTLADLRKRSLKRLQDATLQKLDQLWRGAARIDVIYLVGGGAVWLIDIIKAAGYPQAVLLDNAQLANARGYLNYALFKAGHN